MEKHHQKLYQNIYEDSTSLLFATKLAEIAHHLIPLRAAVGKC